MHFYKKEVVCIHKVLLLFAFLLLEYALDQGDVDVWGVRDFLLEVFNKPNELGWLGY